MYEPLSSPFFFSRYDAPDTWHSPVFQDMWYDTTDNAALLFLVYDNLEAHTLISQPKPEAIPHIWYPNGS